MKKLVLIALLVFGMNMNAQSYSDRQYQYMEMTNVYGVNFVDFKLTWDNYTGTDNCNNNIQIFAQEIDININFEIYLDDVLYYTGWAKLPANTNYFLNDAFYDCNSSKKNVTVNVTRRYD